ncbi:glycosyltransferase family 2 protein [Clostridium gasigenes]|uniref:glycosyltransferase family 2 protein n=1 Tax=Clostridium gasigenes TaxID=94869 RepID=UPI001629F95F|nr:glycosyltransferase family 2 protein [Clostridium gasigenes]MBB6624651.1 glycosyltransferase family 2 protein [Clostridium gasigenes]
MDNVFCTVFTPTYNRKDTIYDLYDSLRKQSNKDFEWIIVDDGSTDKTEEVINDIRKNEQTFSITYVKQENGGKHRAINKGLDHAKGKMFFIVDSDDTLTYDAIELIKHFVDSLNNTDEPIAAVAGLRMGKDGYVIGGAPINEYIDCANSRRKQYDLLGDKAEVYFTNVLKQYRFPTFEGETFLTECIVWNKIADDGYKIRWFNKSIYICEYQEAGLTNNLEMLKKNNPKGYLLNIKTDMMYLKLNTIQRLGYIYGYYFIVKDIKGKKEISTELEVNILELYLAIIAKKIKNYLKGQ